MKQLEQSTFALPDFLQVSEEDIHQRMLKSLPRNYDLSEGALIYDVTKPVAMEKAKMIEYELTLTMMMMFPQFAEGIFLDWHGTPIGVTRRPAVAAKGSHMVFIGKPGVTIQAGTKVATVASDHTAAIVFKTTQEITTDENGKAVTSIEAVEPGVVGNVPAESIRILMEPIPGIVEIINEEATSGGADIESDSSFRERIIDRDQNKSLSGARRDYERWAKEVPGVGEVIVLPEWNGAGTVKVMITDSNGGVATPELIAAVQQHIAPDERKGGGLAPIGALVTVDSVERMTVHLSFSLELEDGADIEEILASIKQAVAAYFSEVSIGGLIRYARIGSFIIETQGVKDYDNLLLNGLAENIQLESGEIAVVGEVKAS